MIQGILVGANVQIEHGTRRIGMPKEYLETRADSTTITLTLQIPKHTPLGELRALLGQGIEIKEYTPDGHPKRTIIKTKTKKRLTLRG